MPLATFSACGTYRYHLVRRWGPGNRTLSAIGLNPGDAAGELNGPTIRRWIGAAKTACFDALSVVNLFAYRATDWRRLRQLDDDVRIGPENDAWIRRVSSEGAAVMVAWGCHGDRWKQRVQNVIALIQRPMLCLGTTRSGQPRHPMVVLASQQLVPWVAPQLQATSHPAPRPSGNGPKPF